MINNYLTVAWRSLLRKKVFSAINILGLSIGMAACFLIAHYVRFELSYDRYHENVDRIYRVLIRIDAPDFSQLSAANHPGTAPTMKADFPEVEEATRLVHQSIFSGQQATWQ
jgi:putative ABC transport system permease protein